MSDKQSIFANWQFVASLGAAIFTYVASVTLSIAQRHKVRLALFFLVAGFVVLSAYQFLNFRANQEKEDLEAFKENLISSSLDQIKLGVSDIQINVKNLSAKISDIPIANFGRGLVVFQDQIDLRQPLEIYPKGDISRWESYASWLKRSDRPEGSVPCLSIAVNAGHHYKVSLLLAYLMTSKETTGPIQSILFRAGDSWRRFPRVEGFFEAYGNILAESPSRFTHRLGYVLFFDGTPANPIGYANAMDWARDLLIYQELDEPGTENRIEKIEKMLSELPAGKDAKAALAMNFSSFRQSIIKSSSVKGIVQNMVENKLAEAVVFTDKEIYIVELGKIVALATRAE